MPPYNYDLIISETDAMALEQDPTAGLDPNAVAEAEEILNEVVA